MLTVVSRWQDVGVVDPACTAVVIDVLRWSTVVVTALARGAVRVEAVAEPQGALARAAELGQDIAVLGGERESVRLPGFALGNSPSEYSRAAVAGKVVVTTTTNGTQALLAAGAARVSLVAAFVNLPAVVSYLTEVLAGNEPVLLLCAGQAGAEATEDTGCAGAIVAALVDRGVLGREALSPSARRALAVWEGAGRDVRALFASAPHAQALVDAGFGADLEAAAAIGAHDLVPVGGVGVVAPG